jgi:hypothetical protein
MPCNTILVPKQTLAYQCHPHMYKIHNNDKLIHNQMMTQKNPQEISHRKFYPYDKNHEHNMMYNV